MQTGTPGVRGLKIFVAVFALAAVLSLVISLGLLEGRRQLVLPGSGKVGRLDITGPIIASGEAVEELKRLEGDGSVAALLVRIDSPGGAVTPSQEIYGELLRIRKKGEKKVVVSIGNLGASGAYYISSAADRIYANPGSLVGSIGVILELTRFGNLLGKLGIESEVVKSGPYKDIGSPLRPLTPEEKQLLQGVIDDTHRQFVDAVAAGRRMDREKVAALADGRIFTGAQAKDLGLVDELGGLEDALKGAAHMAGIEGTPQVVKHRPKGWRYLLEDATSSLLGRLGLSAGPGLRYLWRP